MHLEIVVELVIFWLFSLESCQVYLLYWRLDGITTLARKLILWMSFTFQKMTESHGWGRKVVLWCMHRCKRGYSAPLYCCFKAQMKIIKFKSATRKCKSAIWNFKSFFGGRGEGAGRVSGKLSKGFNSNINIFEHGNVIQEILLCFHILFSTE